MNYADRIAIEPGKRGGRPVVRGLRITVYDVLGWLADGMTADEVLEDFPELEREDILACLAYAADRERHSVVLRAP
jgi:uncharacterized protein (DUF433 family)